MLPAVAALLQNRVLHANEQQLVIPSMTAHAFPVTQSPLPAPQESRLGPKVVIVSLVCSVSPRASRDPAEALSGSMLRRVCPLLSRGVCSASPKHSQHPQRESSLIRMDRPPALSPLGRGNLCGPEHASAFPRWLTCGIWVRSCSCVLHMVRCQII